jgi:hypothetical protein
MKSSISRRLPTMLEHRIWARMLHGRLGVKTCRPRLDWARPLYPGKLT